MRQDLALANTLRTYFLAVYDANYEGRWLEVQSSDSPEIRKAVTSIREILECPADNVLPKLKRIAEEREKRINEPGPEV